ncbi:peptidylprolyl isomerase [Marinirhabdus gelatinilytica]|uniref:Peptidyl-prolyl cis-trans isomerase n=1 Tax=Marinirhabdus gelatinilytica TaxID=1703343 RepID=A0A370QFI2_9FLAO|nr:peptidylprolyl isomerase [Marinirhabdus gelatinilytica]RDK87125.1 cyclophilin family peptidyl-prolyl cis-trans isomerase [Marinirhabdus gelatinilytica]
MRTLFAIVLIGLFWSCEDTKNTSQGKEKILPKTETTTNTEAPVEKSAQENKKTNPFANYPTITNENVVGFFTQYGKENPETKVKLSTRLGDIYISLYQDTPLHRANFIFLVKNGYFSDTFFHRVVPNFIIQGGNSDLASTNKKRAAIGPTYLLPAEINGRDHFYGSVSGAKEYRENPDKKSAPFEFFIFLGPLTSTSHLNGNYTVFGKVTKGMEVVEEISKLESDDGEWPLQNVYITAQVVD